VYERTGLRQHGVGHAHADHRVRDDGLPCPYDDRKPFKISRRAPDIHGHCPEPGIHRGAEILRATLPEMWSVIENSQSPATRGLIGYAAGGDLDIPLRFDVAFDGAIDDMKPPTEKGCYHHGDPPYPAASVEDITAQTGDGTGFRKMGDRTAEYRVWQANCPNEMEPQIHQTWLLPDSDIAIYEQRATEFNDAVVQSMQLLR
jgi:hypothetical protein